MLLNISGEFNQKHKYNGYTLVGFMPLEYKKYGGDVEELHDLKSTKVGGMVPKSCGRNVFGDPGTLISGSTVRGEKMKIGHKGI